MRVVCVFGDSSGGVGSRGHRGCEPHGLQPEAEGSGGPEACEPRRGGGDEAPQVSSEAGKTGRAPPSSAAGSAQAPTAQRKTCLLGPSESDARLPGEPPNHDAELSSACYFSQKWGGPAVVISEFPRRTAS